MGNILNIINIDKTSHDDIITYKKDNDVVYGYFNQAALDSALYNRAKERTHDFKDKAKWDDERNKRAVTLKDIVPQKHTVLFKPISDGEYISKDCVILVVGLDYLDYGNYFRQNNISEYETLLCCGIQVFSKYSGLFNNKISDTIIGYTNTGNTIKDGDLLFTIKLSEKPHDEEFDIKTIKFTYNLLDKEFIASTEGNMSVYLAKWLVNDFSYVNKGDDVLMVSNKKDSSPCNTQTIKSPGSGLLVHGVEKSCIKETLDNCDILFTLYANETVLISDRLKYSFDINKDDFTNSCIVECKFCDSYWGREMSSYNQIRFGFEYTDGKFFLILHYDKKIIKLDKNCTLLLLLDNGNVLSLNPKAKPVDEKCKFQLSIGDLDELEKASFTRWRINNEEGIILTEGNNNCIPTPYEVRNISYDAFKKFIADFRKVVKDNAPEKELEEQLEIANNTQRTCHVYLMIDTTNNFHKIGISNSPKYREHTLQSDKPTIELICSKEYPSRDIAEAIESALHRVYASKRIRGEWFNLDTTDIENIKQTLK